MADKSNIQWTDATWNPIVGCSLESPGCTNCYAMRQAFRIQAMMRGLGKESHYDGTTKVVKGKPVWTGLMRQAPEHILLQPLRWTTPRMIFVNSMSDLFHPDVPDEWIDQVFAVMALCPQHTFQVLTKRAERMRSYLTDIGLPKVEPHWGERRLVIHSFLCAQDGLWNVGFKDLVNARASVGNCGWPLPNVWLGVSTEDQKRADERIPHLLQTPAAVRFLSAEPLLGAIDLRMVPHSPLQAAIGRWLDWIIVGGESGPNARPMHPDWARSLRDQCAAAGVPFFFKQWGEWKEAFHDEDGPYVNEVDNESDEADALLAALAGKPGWLHADGRFFRDRKILPEEEPVRLMERMGKARAGRLLDGREHNDMPEVRR